MPSQRPGQPLTVRTNAFSITKLPTKAYYQYSDFEPEQRIRKRRQEIIHELQVQYPQYFNPRFAYDGNAILFASRVLDFGGQSNATLEVRLGPNASARIKVTLTRTQAEPIKPTNLNALIQTQGGSVSLEQSTPAINLLQLIIRQGQNWTNFPRNARAYFVETGSQKIGGGLELWRGFFQSVRPSIGRMLINIDVSMAAMYESGSVIDIAVSLLGFRDARQVVKLTPRDPKYRILEKHFKKRQITVKSPGMRGRKRVISLEPNAGNYVFEENGMQTTVARYFKSKHNITILHPECFGFVVSIFKDGSKAVVPAELCAVVPGQMYRGKIPEDIQSGAVQRFATMKPHERLRAIQEGTFGNQRLEGPAQQYATNDIIAEAGMEINLQPLQVNGRILDVPQVVYGGHGGAVQPRNGSWNLVGKMFHTAASLPVWAIVNFVGSIQTSIIQTFARTLKDSCVAHGMNVADCADLITGSPQAPEKSLGNALDQMLAYVKKFGLAPENILFIIILPQNAAPIRAAVKFWGDVMTGVITQCVREKKIFDRGRSAFNDQYCNNVALKINARLGGINSIPLSNTLNLLKQQPFIIMGADVSHPGPGVRDKPSVASLVFSHDRHGTQYASMTRVQPPREERIHDLEEMVKRAVLAFGKKNKASPARIIFYRDGLSEGEYQVVADSEIKAVYAGVQQAFMTAGISDPRPKLTFIVVGKRHHIRFFPPPSHADRSGNCPPGFVADTGLQSPFASDYYLQSHGGLLGTSRPSHYIVLLDEVFESNMDHLQALSFALCHAYCKATRSVSIPAPVYYADLVCSRAAFYFDPSLDFTGSDASSVSTGGTSQFQLAPWRDGYRPIHERVFRSMFYI